jgi:hypothetical protein
MKAVPGNVGTLADEADVTLIVRLTDIRRRGDLADYTGELRASVPLRITDTDNGPTGGATVLDGTFAWNVPCAATESAANGATCDVATSADAVVAGAIKEGKSAVWELGQLQVFDGGPDGDGDTTPNTLFAVQGLFVP